MTQPLVERLFSIHGRLFRSASNRIKKHQCRYKKNYDKKFKAKKFNLKVMTKCQYRRTDSNKSVLSKQKIWSYCPRNGYYLIAKVDHVKKRVQLMTPEGKLLSRWHCFDNIRKFHSK